MKRRFFFVTDGQKPGGSELLWVKAGNKLANDGHYVAAQVCMKSGVTELHASLLQAGAELFDFKRLDLVGKMLHRLRWGRNNMYGIVGSRRPHLVVYCSPGHPIQPYLPTYCRRAGLRYSVIVQAAADTTWPDPALAEEIALAYLKAHCVYFVSHGNRRLVERQLGISLSNASIVRNPFQVPYNYPPPWPTGDGYRLACVARLHGPHKGHDLLFDVFATPKWRERNLSLSLYGSGPHEALYRRRCEQLALRSVRFAGHTSDIRSVWEAHHALILPSRSEGLPLALVEALLSDRVAIVTDVAGNAELVRDGETGFIAAAPTAALLNEALERAWQRRDDWPAMGRLAGELVRREVPRDPPEDLARSLLSNAEA